MSVTEIDGIYCKVDELCLDANERNELKVIADIITFDQYFDVTYNLPDNNLIGQVTESLPEWFQLKAEKFLVEGWPIFLKNKGDVIRHTDDKRSCSITIPLNRSNTPTVFDYNTKLYHNGDTYLQNNQVTHRVPRAEEYRYFLQISFEQSYEHIKSMLNKYN